MSNSFHYTPKDIGKKLLKDVSFNENDFTLEACKGIDNSGGFWEYIPFRKDWCEIEEGRDIFKYDCGEKYTKIICNAPYRTNAPDGKRVNILIKFMDRCFDLCDGEVWHLLNMRSVNSLTPLRLKKWSQLGWNITFLRVLNINKWYGRYYWICFKKGGNQSIIHF